MQLHFEKSVQHQILAGLFVIHEALKCGAGGFIKHYSRVPLILTIMSLEQKERAVLLIHMHIAVENLLTCFHMIVLVSCAKVVSSLCSFIKNRFLFNPVPHIDSQPFFFCQHVAIRVRQSRPEDLQTGVLNQNTNLEIILSKCTVVHPHYTKHTISASKYVTSTAEHSGGRLINAVSSPAGFEGDP